MADHCFLWLWDNMPPVEALDILLTVALPKIFLDDHYFIFPALPGVPSSGWDRNISPFSCPGALRIALSHGTRHP